MTGQEGVVHFVDLFQRILEDSGLRVPARINAVQREIHLVEFEFRAGVSCVRRRTVVAGIARRSPSGLCCGMEKESGEVQSRIWKFSVPRAQDRVRDRQG